MKRLLVLAATAAAIATTTSPAAAYPTYAVSGGCAVQRIANDGTNNSQTTWTATVTMSIAALDAALGTPAPTAPIAAWCDMYFNGVYRTTLLEGSGTGAINAARDWTYYADSDDVLTVCTAASVGDEQFYECEDGSGLPSLPYVGHDETGIDPYWSTWQGRELLKWLNFWEWCPAFGAVAPGVTGVVDVTPEGDLYVLGTRYNDCPPFEDR